MLTGYSDEVRYHPWVGDQYWQQEQRWLILGESSYQLHPTDTMAVPDMIRAHCGDATVGFEKGTYRVCAAAERLMSGRNELDPARFWQKVAFYNYVLESMADSKARPTTLQYRQSLPAFNEVVCELKPHVVLVLGIKLWDALPGEREGWQKGPELEVSMPTNSRKLSLWTANVERPLKHHIFKCFPVAHPSSRGFKADAWKDWMIAAKATVAAQIGR
ncbi:hypothetical protein [Paraburkholderia sp. MM5482-R1]|uniref:hypothetical protein n=1 Tax=unclassified Paraburkholderia TaxID=2615204 RepID=UPI003D1E83DB